MKTTTLLLLFLASVIAALHAGSLDNKNPTMSIRATDLYEAYEKNALAAGQQYKAKRVSIGGQVKEIAEEDGAPYLLLRGREHSFYGIKCRFTPEFVAKLATLKPGVNVAVHGTIEGRRESSGDVVVVDCRFP